MRYRIIHSESKQMVGPFFKATDNGEGLIERIANSLMGRYPRDLAQGVYIVQSQDGTNWNDTDVKINNRSEYETKEEK